MLWPTIAATCLLVPTGYWGTLLAVNGRRRRDEPPLLRGALPFLGKALAFGRDGMALLAQARERHGDVFTLYIGGQRMTFVLDPLSVPAILKAEQLSFAPIADDVVDKGFGLARVRELAGFEELERISKIYLKGTHLRTLTGGMEEELRRLLPRHVEGRQSLDLYRFIWDLMFAAGNTALFGQRRDGEEFARAFAEFDDAFPLMVAGLPRFLVKRGAAGLDHLAATLATESSDASEWVQRRNVLFDAAELSPDDRGRLQTTVLWAAQANTLPATFWAVAHVLRDPEAQAAIRRELDSVDVDALTTETLDSMRVLDSAIRESLRLSSGSLTVRRVMADFMLETPGGRWALREGDRVCIAPYLYHRDPEIFEEPERYRYGRFLSERGAKQFFKNGTRVPMPLMPFGAGVSMCPGRHFAINEIKLLTALLLSQVDLELAEPEAELPGFDLSRVGLGIYPPAEDLQVRVRAGA